MFAGYLWGTFIQSQDERNFLRLQRELSCALNRHLNQCEAEIVIDYIQYPLTAINARVEEADESGHLTENSNSEIEHEEYGLLHRSSNTESSNT